MMETPLRFRSTAQDVATQISVVRGDLMGFRLAEMLEPGALEAKNLPALDGVNLSRHIPVRLVGVDGACWASIAGITERGRLVLVPDLAVQAVPMGADLPSRRGRPAQHPD